jgi:hypothetical protein
MKKLETRQIIVLAVAVIAALYGAYEFLVAGPALKKAKTAPKQAQIADFVEGVSADLIKYKTAGVDAYISKKAEEEWRINPFWERNAYREFAGEHIRDGSSRIIYSGYVDAGGKRTAVINGWEYEAGDALEIEGYFLKSVNPARVLIINRNTGGELSIPIQE